MAPTDQLTARQREVFDMIYEQIINRGYGPTVREIADQFGIASPNGVVCHLKALEKKGLIIRSPNKSRAIELTDEVLESQRGLPLAGTVAAGMTTLAFEQQDRIDIGGMFSGSDEFVLQVSGDSMIEAHIADGDYVVVRKQPTARSGDMVVARTDEGEATLKYWYPESGRIRLQPANASMDPIYVDNAQVVGIVTGVVRTV
ncbi:MAG TPA: repressor LexA [Planctomycetaceae bacterium]|jgi:repressor LexA|nr:repressor LexA [Rhodopirellula sp.]MCH2359978.1 transcriptional repressor LexA [Pirellulales bacterium]HAL15103.1 repressor LexA [Planctomycetaceae bacterium]HCK70225.1 repressor LexA [Planctomycetaceae bacterium]HCP85855.1 repressor LexA [Planctomycetaceae bacterium]|tara:strand:+ start:2138 stop:2740 length:603 start_codon:yes stop_codon:yes gene_type:complete